MRRFRQAVQSRCRRACSSVVPRPPGRRTCTVDRMNHSHHAPAFNVDVKRAALRSDVLAGGARLATAELDPWLWAIGLNYDF